MKLGFRIKHYFYNAFREIFVHHHGSLTFRAKLFSLIIAANDHTKIDNFILVKKLGLQIYKEDEERANLLLLSTKELVQKIKEKNDLDIDSLILRIQNELKVVPRYAHKIDIDALKLFLEHSDNEDTLLYQKNIIEFLEKLKNETLTKK
ncbi:hypothetical protein [Sulfurimonas sp.]|uniref:hypothetical protein n=1 Tax=Sulfurimonas sp. TaxID=2022749 RepID=UPI002631B7B8|nr:hypothetical protein [Sulfurimonas sp.]